MDKVNRSQLPDSSSSPPLGGIFHNFDDEGMSDLPSCIYANVHHHHQLNPGQISISNLGMTSQTTNNFKIHQHFMHHNGELTNPPATSSTSPMNATFIGPIKNSRLKETARERKKTIRSAPNG